MLKLEGRSTWHFPRNDDGQYANLYPADSKEAIDHLENLRSRGATSLVIPEPAFWWLEFYRGFAAHLKQHYSLVADDPQTCMIFDLEGRRA